jgi:hypothetical protein
MALLGVPPEQFAVAGLVVLVYQFWIHTEHIGKLGWFDRVFSSPSNHRVHHAVNDQYINKNYGGMLVIWDRLFGTFAEEAAPCVYGTRKPLRSWDPGWAIVAEYCALAQASRQARTWPDKLRVWFKQPGWRPADAVPAPAFDLAAAGRLYEAPDARPHPALALLQFALMTAATAACLWVAEELAYAQAFGLGAAVIAGLWGLGAYLQGRLRAVAVVAIDVAGLAAAYLLLHSW